MNKPLRVISLGAGVQSTTMALMAAAGEIAAPDCAIFADTGWEPAAVYAHLDQLERALPFPVHRVSAGNLREDTWNRSNTTAGRIAAVPWYTRQTIPAGTVVPVYSVDEHDETVQIGTRTLTRDEHKDGMGRRQCTKEYKLRPIQRKVVELLGGKRPKNGCEMLIGISTDEASRMKPSRVQYIVNRFPLIERDMSRRACQKWLEAHGWKAPRSACIACPYRSDAEWRALTPPEFAEAVETDRRIRNQPGFRAEQFVHRSLKPLSEVDLSTAEERGQLTMFNDECEGMCGV